MASRQSVTYSLRDVTDVDHEFLVELHNDPLVLRNITNPNPITLEDHLAWWSKIRTNSREKRMIFCVDGIAAGFTKFYSIDLINGNCVLGADLDKQFRSQGHSKHMWNLMLKYCFEELKLHRVSLTTAEFNSIAIHLYEKLGFVKEGNMFESLFRDGKFYSQTCYYMTLEQYMDRDK